MKRDTLVVALKNPNINSKKFHMFGKDKTKWSSDSWVLTSDIRKQMPMNDGGKTEMFLESSE